MSRQQNKRLTFNIAADPFEEARRAIEAALDEHGARSAKAVANLSGISVSTVYRYRKTAACRMQLPTFMALKAGASKRLK